MAPTKATMQIDVLKQFQPAHNLLYESVWKLNSLFRLQVLGFYRLEQR